MNKYIVTGVKQDNITLSKVLV